MARERTLRDARASVSRDEQSSELTGTSKNATPLSDLGLVRRHPFFQSAWYAVNALLVISALLAPWSIGWEYSTRRYLQGFTDAIVPASAPPEAKITAILNWMTKGPARQMTNPDALFLDRDPTETLNYNALLQVCGTATNAFLNLADSGHLQARRLLLLDTRGKTKHVVAEVLVDGQWIVVDPSYRTILRGEDAKPLTKDELADPKVFAAATENISGYKSQYDYAQTAHIRLARLRFVARFLQPLFDRLLPGWEGSPTTSLLLERSSLASAVGVILLVLILILLRISLRWYGEKLLGVYPVRIRDQIRRAGHAFLDTAR